MCGIYGTTIAYEPELIKKKLDLMKFRGPDNTGFKGFEYLRDLSSSNGSLTLGHVRLSIVDLDPRSNQPFEYNENISIVFNGEVYNHKELRKRYFSNLRFRTESDTEVICAMYDRCGKDWVKYFNGMFACVIFDRKQNILFGARDRLGKKPFYYRYVEKGENRKEKGEYGFEFASQIKSLAYGNNLEIDETARALYLLHGWIPDPYCIYKGVKKLRGGECFTYCLDTNELKTEQYWDIHTNSSRFQIPNSYDEAKEQVKELLYDAVKLRLDADVPVGTFLSGGIDSSLVCAIVSKYNKNLCAYTARFENKEFDESIYAVDTANHLEVPVKVCDCTGSDLLNVFNDYLDYFDEPFADDSLIPTSLVAQKAREDVTVILGGDGGDELFYGYPKYEWTKSRLVQYKKPYWLRKLMTPYFLHRGGEMDVFQSTQRDYADVYQALGFFCYGFEGAERFDRMVLSKKMEYGELLKNKERGVLAYTDYDMRTFMNAVNMKVDRATMRCSMELRSPLQDYRLAEYSRLLPFEYQYGKYGLKTILKDILYEIVPKELFDRPKRGFVPPTADWFRGELKEEILDVVSYKNVKNLLPELDTDKFIYLRDTFINGDHNNVRIIFSVYTYIQWYNRYKQ